MDFNAIFHVLTTAVVLLIMICILVAAHEYGHYLFARLFGMGVEEFAIGFGKKPIWTWMRKTYSVEAIPGPAGKSGGSESKSLEYATDGALALQPQAEPEPAATPTQVKLVTTETTDFTVRPWPLGGFVRIKGMIPEEDGSETKIPGGFYSKAPWKRFIVLLAGPTFSVLAGILIIIGVLTAWGKPTALDKPVIEIPDPATSAAYAAGLRSGDRIISIDGKPTDTFYAITANVVDKGGKQITVVYQSKDGKEKQATVTPTAKTGPVMQEDLTMTKESKPNAGRLGVIPTIYQKRVSFGEAIKDGFSIPGEVISSLANLVKKPSELKDAVGGPGSIAKATSDATKQGIDSIIMLAAGLSISVGIFNLLPIFPLDGGQMLVAVAEMLRGGRRLSIKVQGAVSAVGLALVAMLFVSVVWIDFGRLTKKSDPPAPKPVQKQTQTEKTPQPQPAK